ASFIGSHLVEALIKRGVQHIRIIDNLTAGRFENVKDLFSSSNYFEFIKADLRDPGVAKNVVEDIDTIFHLAADHGGRGYVDLHQYACSTNLGLDAILFRSALDAGVEKIVYASSGCIYPLFMQTNPDEVLYITEDMAGPPYGP